ncbi:MarR family transcriptional regulator [Salinisphaera sp. PC39]
MHSGNETMSCSVARAVDAIGDRWTVLILREAFWGVRRFESFQANLGIARNVLSDRLRRLAAHGILERVSLTPGGKRAEYHLTRKGADLFRVLVVLMQWGDRWTHDGEPPVRLIARTNGEPIAEMAVRDSDGRALGLMEMRPEPGPGANDATRRRLAAVPGGAGSRYQSDRST